jgi:hypothetical protein
MSVSRAVTPFEVIGLQDVRGIAERALGGC